jgi:drug/metabolite transporter (DMT)-like permease
MSPTRIAGIVLIVAGALMLAYGGFSYTKEETPLKIGPVELKVQEKKTVDFPVWAGIGAIVVGGLLLVLGGKR